MEPVKWWSKTSLPSINVSSRNRLARNKLAEPGKRFPRNRSEAGPRLSRSYRLELERRGQNSRDEFVNCSLYSLYVYIERDLNPNLEFSWSNLKIASKNFDTKKRIFSISSIFFLWSFRIDCQENERTIFSSVQRADTSSRWNLIKIVTAYFDEGFSTVRSIVFRGNGKRSRVRLGVLNLLVLHLIRNR